MTELVKQGTWVEVSKIVLAADERAPQVPEDAWQVPLEMRVKGYLMESAALGNEVEIETAVGRCLRGILREINPAYTHTFGAPIPELSTIGGEVRALLCTQGQRRRGYLE